MTVTTTDLGAMFGLQPTGERLRRCRRAGWDTEKRSYRCLDCGAGGFGAIADFERHERSGDVAADWPASPRLRRTARKGLVQ